MVTEPPKGLRANLKRYWYLPKLLGSLILMALLEMEGLATRVYVSDVESMIRRWRMRWKDKVQEGYTEWSSKKNWSGSRVDVGRPV